MNFSNKKHRFNFLKILVPFFLLSLMIIFKSNVYALEATTINEKNEETEPKLTQKKDEISKILEKIEINNENIKSTNDDVDYNFFKKRILDVSDSILRQNVITQFLDPIRDPNNPDAKQMLQFGEEILDHIYKLTFENRNELVKKFFDF
ncbi:hypothetical protein [Candidatus Phytoplasma asteris]|uniref:Sequence-variable mosaic (SVM) signal sequence domain-containing protein n=2 Tax=16SrI (Aster yellows group) TaxID=3042590 RepID=A0ABZ3CDN6_9MOLU|nr:MAG: putative secreted protein [Rapeseed phyllody phytoplasma]